MFRALDDAADVKNLLSMELTGAYINEAREIPREIVEALDGRINQFPAKKDGGASWAGIWADTNPPEEGSYWHSMIEGLDPDTGEIRKNDWVVFSQPGGMIRVAEGEPYEVKMRNGWKLRTNPNADNLANLPDGYYSTLARDKSDEYVKVYIMGMYGQSKAGKPVHPMFSQDMHVANEILVPNPKLLLLISADFGLTPAMTLKQQDTVGRVLTLDEIVTEGMGLKRAINERLKPLLRNKYTDFNIQVTGDPAGNTASQTDEKSCVDIFREAGFSKVKFAYSNNPVHRTNATDTFLGRVTEMGPAYLVSPQCAYLIRGMKGGYHYKVNKFGITSETPEKNIYSHVCFVAGTPIRMADGTERPIEQVQTGQCVATPLGPCRSARMDREAEVVTVTFSDGRSLLVRRTIRCGWARYLPMADVARMRLSVKDVNDRVVWGVSAEPAAAPQTVYNIEVEDAHCYYANVCLVSNCEAGQYADMFFERGFESVDRAKQRKEYLQQVQGGAGIYARRS